ncbi:MAG: hypothetical protein ACM3U2_16590 [Deltaproteobacteria bacterium]
MRQLPIAVRIVDVLASCSQHPSQWPAEVRADCALIHARYEALKLDIGAADAWRQARLEWVRNVMKGSGMVRVAYHFRDCPQPGI